MANAKAKAPTPAPKKAKSISKTELLKTLAEASEVDKKTVGKVLDELAALVGTNLGKKGPGVIAIPGLVKIKVVHKPATPAVRKMVLGEMRDISAKPARKVVKVQALKALKDMA